MRCERRQPNASTGPVRNISAHSASASGEHAANGYGEAPRLLLVAEGSGENPWEAIFAPRPPRQGVGPHQGQAVEQTPGPGTGRPTRGALPGYQPVAAGWNSQVGVAGA
jgi:hypothetical protein